LKTGNYARVKTPACQYIPADIEKPAGFFDDFKYYSRDLSLRDEIPKTGIISK